MNLEQFLDCGNKQTFAVTLANNSFICFSGKEYPLLFFSLLSRELKKEASLQLQRVDLQSGTIVQTISQLETCFLGTTSTYWLSNISTLDSKTKKRFLAYCKTYSGPNVLMLFIADTVQIKKAEKRLIIKMPMAVDQKLFMVLARSLMGNEKTYQSFAVQLFKKYKTIPLDTACLVLQYARVLGSAQQDFLDAWLDVFIAPQQSLFLLSQYFFARQPTLFFARWSRLSDAYSPQFWSVFWSEQLWRAHHYVRFTKQGNIPAARKIGFRLPFSFLRKDWRTLPLENIRKAHQHIYEIDFSLKNGGDSGVFDLFYSQFFMR